MRGTLLTFTIVAALAVAAPASAEPIEVGHIPECTEAVPAALSLDQGQAVGIHVRVLLDGVSLARGQQVMSQAAASYGPLSMPLTASYQGVVFTGNEAESLINQSRDMFGGGRPAGVDVVYLLTNKDIAVGGNTAVAGLADCIGGVAFPDRAFAVGENLASGDAAGFGPLVLSANLSAKVAAHEVGHLYGGHHHYANCAEGVFDSPGGGASTCTLMVNDVGLASMNLSSLNSLVVRGHGEAFAP